MMSRRNVSVGRRALSMRIRKPSTRRRESTMRINKVGVKRRGPTYCEYLESECK
jgi:hypothetical protein